MTDKIDEEEKRFSEWKKSIDDQMRQDFVMLGPRGMEHWLRKCWLAGRLDLIDELKKKGAELFKHEFMGSFEEGG